MSSSNYKTARSKPATGRRFHEFAGCPWSEAAEAQMRRYVATNKGDRYGKFIYSTDLIGVDIAALHEELAPYRQRYGLPIEQRQQH